MTTIETLTRERDEARAEAEAWRQSFEGEMDGGRHAYHCPVAWVLEVQGRQ